MKPPSRRPPSTIYGAYVASLVIQVAPNASHSLRSADNYTLNHHHNVRTQCLDLGHIPAGRCDWYVSNSGLNFFADKAADRATSELLPSGSEDIALNLEICDQIRSKSAPARDAMRAIKRRLNHKNPNVQLLALGVRNTVQLAGYECRH